MRLLITTQKIDKNDDILGFFHSWVLEFAKHCDQIVIICLEKGEYEFPKNVRVRSLGKIGIASNQTNRLFRKIKYGVVFLKYTWKERKNYDTVFVHMNPEYAVIGGIIWRLLRKKIGLWYVHRKVDLKLYIAEKLVHCVFTASKESFKLKSNKIHIIGHGIDLSVFSSTISSIPKEPFRILYVGRITKIKNLDILLEAASILKETWNKSFSILLVGSPVTGEDESYFQELKRYISSNDLCGCVKFKGSIPYREIKNQYQNADLMVNLVPTGGVDKAVLESIISGTLAISSNKAFENLYGPYSTYLLVKERSATDLVEKMKTLLSKNTGELQDMIENLKKTTKKRFSLERVISNIIEELRVI